MRMQPEEIAWPIYSGWLVPWILYTLLAAINEDWTSPTLIGVNVRRLRPPSVHRLFKRASKEE
jgi:hypothetical protein